MHNLPRSIYSGRAPSLKANIDAPRTPGQRRTLPHGARLRREESGITIDSPTLSALVVHETEPKWADSYRLCVGCVGDVLMRFLFEN